MTDIRKETLKVLVAFQKEAANYFRKRPTGGEDKAHWANVYNAENCDKTANVIEVLARQVDRLQGKVRSFAHNQEALAKERDENLDAVREWHNIASVETRKARTVTLEQRHTIALILTGHRNDTHMTDGDYKTADKIIHQVLNLTVADHKAWQECGCEAEYLTKGDDAHFIGFFCMEAVGDDRLRQTRCKLPEDE